VPIRNVPASGVHAAAADADTAGASVAGADVGAAVDPLLEQAAATNANEAARTAMDVSRRPAGRVVVDIMAPPQDSGCRTGYPRRWRCARVGSVKKR
jgi:hypothetical protein